MSPRAFCPECQHCRKAAQRSELRLPASTASPDWLVRFATVYRLARSLSKQPSALLRDVNPELTAEQVNWYRRRAVDLGLLDRVRGTDPVATAPEAPAAPSVMHPDLRLALEYGTPLSVRLVRAVVPGMASDAAAEEYMAKLREAGEV